MGATRESNYSGEILAGWFCGEDAATCERDDAYAKVRLVRGQKCRESPPEIAPLHPFFSKSWDLSHFLRNGFGLSVERHRVLKARTQFCDLRECKRAPLATLGQRHPRVIWQKMQVELFLNDSKGPKSLPLALELKLITFAWSPRPQYEARTSAAVMLLLGQKKRSRPQSPSWRSLIRRCYRKDPLLDSRNEQMSWLRREKPRLAA
jgi:hypothetical protein